MRVEVRKKGRVRIKQCTVRSGSIAFLGGATRQPDRSRVGAAWTQPKNTRGLGVTSTRWAVKWGVRLGNPEGGSGSRIAAEGRCGTGGMSAWQRSGAPAARGVYVAMGCSGGLEARRRLHQSTLHGMARPSTVNWLASVGSNAIPLSVSRCRESRSNFQDLPFSAISLDVRQNCRREQQGRQRG